MTTALTSDLVARMDEISSDREAYRVQPGWWVRGINPDGSREWSQVRTTMHGVHVPTQQKVVRVFSVPPGETAETIEMCAFHCEPVLCLTKAEARKLRIANDDRDY